MWIRAADSRLSNKKHAVLALIKWETGPSARIWVQHERHDEMAMAGLGQGAGATGDGLGWALCLLRERWQEMKPCDRDFAQFQKAQLKAGAPEDYL